MGSARCWEILNCARQEDCPAYPNHGRECFAVTGTICRGKQQGSYEEKIAQCRTTCDFYKDVMAAVI